MKKLIIVFALLPMLAVAGTPDTVKVDTTKKQVLVAPKKSTSKPKVAATPNKAKDSTTPADTAAKDKYDIIVFDSGYDMFVATQPSKEFYSLEYLRSKNSMMVREWNMRYNNPSMYNRNIYGSYIDYDFHTDYGMDFEYRLYMFFKYMEEAAHISLGAGNLS